VVSPVLWWTSVRPLQQAARLRDYFLADLFSTIEDERRRIARELHDGVGQTLTMLVVGLRSLADSVGVADLRQREAELCQLAQRALVDAKQLARGLRPSLLDDLGLAAAIERVAAEVEEHHHVPVAVDMQAMTGQRLPERYETALFRIFQEAMANIVQHSGASHVSVRLAREPHRVILNVVDNGCGISATSTTHEPVVDGHLGLVGMQERAALLGGTIAIEPADGRGTKITVTIPV
jgi:signal transduction histidine kinase